MKVHIKETLFPYTSDFPDGWVFAKGDYFKKVNIDKYTCFVKRFEVKTPESISAWQLLLELKGKYENNLARLFDIAATKENGKNIYYILYEFIEGDTLHTLVADDVDINLAKLTDNLFKGITALQNRGYWFPDFVEKNIYCDKKGRFVLIDLDSAYPLSEPPNHDMWADKEYWALVFNFYKEVLGKDELTYSDVHGINLNYLIIIFMVLRFKIHQSGGTKDFHGLFNELPTQLDLISRSFRKIFENLFQNQVAASPETIGEIRNLIEERILPLTHQQILNVMAGRPASIDPHISFVTEKSNNTYKPDIYSTNSHQPDRPVIVSFSAVGYHNKIADDRFEMNKITEFSLVWKTENASAVDLYRDGILCRKMNHGEERVTFTGSTDVWDKDVEYTLKAYDHSSMEHSRSLIVKFTGPVINLFATTKQRVKKDELFTLLWQVKYATGVELFRNGKYYKGYGPNENSVQLKEGTGSVDKMEIEYILLVTDGQSSIASDPVIVALKKFTFRPSAVKLSLAALGVILLVGLIVFFPWQKTPSNLITAIDPFMPDQIAEHQTITLTGKNLPLEKDAVQVEFANVKGAIIRLTKDSLFVEVPSLAKNIATANIDVVINGVLFKASNQVRYLVMSSLHEEPPGTVENLIDKIKPAVVIYPNGNTRLQLENESSLALYKVLIEISYTSNPDQELGGKQVVPPKHESVLFDELRAGAILEVNAPYLYQASNVEVRIKKIDIKKV